MIFDLRRALDAQGKALGPNPAFMDRFNPVGTYAPGTTPPRSDALLSQREAMRHSDAYGGRQAIDWVYDCIGLYSDAASTAPYKLEQKDGTPLVRQKLPHTPPEYAVGPQALYDLLDKPNPFMLYDELVSLLVIDLMLVGNGYWFKWQNGAGGRPLALYRLAPSHIKVKPSQYGPKGYEYQPPGAKNKLVIPPENIIHFRRPNPHSQYYGMGVIQGAGRSMDLELAITDTMASYYENKAEPSVIFSSERRVPRDVFNKLRAQLRARSAGSTKAGELLLLEMGLKADTLSRSAADALFAELSKMSRDRIFAKFRASPRLFGLVDETSGSDKVSDLRRDFDNSALRPFLTKLSNLISDRLADAYDCKFEIDFRQTLPTDEAIKVAESMAAAPGIKIREVRRQYAQFGIDESTGDPQIDNFVLNKPTPEIGPDGMILDPLTGKKTMPQGADRPIGSEAGRPPKASNTKGFGTTVNKPNAGAGKALEALAALEAAAGKAVSTPAPDNSLPGEVPPDNFAVARSADISASMRYVEDGLRDAAVELERALLDHVEGKALKTSDLVQRVRRSEAWTTFRDRITTLLEEGARRAASSGVMHSGLTPEEDVDYDSLVKSVVHRPDGVRGIVKTFRDRVVKQIKDTRSADGERVDLNRAVTESVAGWMNNQAAAIAETEAVHAYNEATLTAAEMSGVSEVYVTDGNDHDEPCREAHGSVWDIAKARENRLQHPRCRRAFLPMPAAEVSS